MPNLTEATNAFILDGSNKVKKWSSKITEANNRLVQHGQKPMSIEGQTALAKVLENTQNRMNYDLRESTQSSMVGPYKRYAMDIITGLFPNLISMDLVNVQAIENKQGIINYIKYTAGSKKGLTAKDSEIASTFNFSGAGKNYTAKEVDSETMVYTYADSKVTTTLDWVPVIPESVSIVAGSTTYRDKGDGALYNGNTAVSGSSINYTTGVVVLPLAADPSTVTASWYYNNEYAPADVPELDLSIESVLVTAQSRKLKALWAFDAAYEMSKEYGSDINALLAAQATAEIAHEIDIEILDKLYNGAYVSASQPAFAWDATVPYGVSQAQHFESLKTTFNRGSNQIFQNTKRAMGNFVVVGTNVASVIESTVSFQAAAVGNVVGPHFFGTWGGYKVYKNPFFDPDQFVVGYKGNTLFDAGFTYCPYMPVSTTQMLMLADFKGQQGWATSYATKMLNNMMYAKGSISNLA